MYNATKRTKLDPKYRRRIFLGYANGLKGYHLWDPTAHKIVINRDVIFVKDQLQRKDEDNSTVKEKSESISIYVENNPEKKFQILLKQDQSGTKNRQSLILGSQVLNELIYFTR